MPIQPPNHPAKITPVPPAQDPPTLQDLTNAINYVEDIKDDCRAFRPDCGTAEDLAIAHTYMATIISARAGAGEYRNLDQPHYDETLADVAPPWFNQAMRSALGPLEEKITRVKADLTTKINEVKAELREAVRTANETHNLQCMNGVVNPYKVVRFLDGTSPPDDHRLPPLHTAQDIRNLSRRNVKRYMDGYGLPLNSADHKRAIANAIGCSVDL